MLAFGDITERCLRFFGITKERVRAITGSDDCGCDKRQAAMNEAGWAWQRWLLLSVWIPVAYRIQIVTRRVTRGRIGRAAIHLQMAVRTLIYGC